MLMQNSGESSTAQHSDQGLGKLAAIKVSGPDRTHFLQGQLTQDVARLTPEHALLAGWASPKGRLLCTPWLADWRDSIWLILPRERAAAIANRLKMFVLRADVQIEVATARVEAARLKDLTTPDKSNTPLDNKTVNYCISYDNEFSIRPAGIEDMGMRVCPGLPDEAVEIQTAALWRLKNIRAGLPIIGDATAEEFVPQMVNLDLLDAISFSKGCYVGQEIVARTQNLGRIKRRMYAFSAAADSAAEPPMPGQPVYGEQGIAGQIVDAVPVETGLELLAVTRIDSLQQTLSLGPDGRQPLTHQPLPYEI